MEVKVGKQQREFRTDRQEKLLIPEFSRESLDL